MLAGLAADRPRPARWWSASRPRPGTSSGGVLDHARAKLARKGCDLLVVNDVGGGKVFGSADNEAVVLGADGSAVAVPPGLQGGARARRLGPRDHTARRALSSPPRPARI